MGIFTTMMVNWSFSIGLSHWEAFGYDLVGGLLVGWLIARYVFIIIMKYIRRKLMEKFGVLFSIAGILLKWKGFQGIFLQSQ